MTPITTWVVSVLSVSVLLLLVHRSCLIAFSLIQIKPGGPNNGDSDVKPFVGTQLSKEIRFLASTGDLDTFTQIIYESTDCLTWFTPAYKQKRNSRGKCTSLLMRHFYTFIFLLFLSHHKTKMKARLLRHFPETLFCFTCFTSTLDLFLLWWQSQILVLSSTACSLRFPNVTHNSVSLFHVAQTALKKRNVLEINWVEWGRPWLCLPVTSSQCTSFKTPDVTNARQRAGCLYFLKWAQAELTTSGQDRWVTVYNIVHCVTLKQ